MVGTPGRILDLATKRKVLDLSHVKHFVLDECDRMLAELDMRKDVQTIFKGSYSMVVYIIVVNCILLYFVLYIIIVFSIYYSYLCIACNNWYG